MSQDTTVAAPELEPLNARQLAFARELGVAIAEGKRDYAEAYEKAGYSGHRGNAARLAADPRIKKIADDACSEALRLAGLHIGYLQARALELLHASPTKIHRTIMMHQAALKTATITPEQLAAFDAELDAVTWPLTEFKIDKDGIISIKLPDKKALIEMLAKQLGHGKDEPGNVNVGVSFQVVTGVPRAPDEHAGH